MPLPCGFKLCVWPVNGMQIPIFISLIWAIRRMLDNAADFEGLTTGGMAWFTELTAYDPTFAFPIATAVVNISAIQVGSGEHVGCFSSTLVR